VWSTALAFHFVVSATESISGADLGAMAKQAANLRLAFDHPAWEHYPISLQALLMAMTRQDPDQRLTLGECLGHSFFQEFLGEEWINMENDEVKMPSDSEMRQMLERIKEAAVEEDRESIH
jgi:hypothetical protein